VIKCDGKPLALWFHGPPRGVACVAIDVTSWLDTFVFKPACSSNPDHLCSCFFVWPRPFTTKKARHAQLQILKRTRRCGGRAGGRLQKKKSGPAAGICVERGLIPTRCPWPPSARQGSTAHHTHPPFAVACCCVASSCSLCLEAWHRGLVSALGIEHNQRLGQQKQGDDTSTPEATARVSQEREDILCCCRAPYARPVTPTHMHTLPRRRHTQGQHPGGSDAAGARARVGDRARKLSCSWLLRLDLAFAARALSFCNRVAPAL